MGVYRRLMVLPGGRIFLKGDEILIMDYDGDVKVRIDWYPYEDGYCITLWRKISDTFSNFCNFKGTIKFEDKKIMLVDFYQFPPIEPAIIITFNGKVEVFYRKDMKNCYECPPKGRKYSSYIEAIYRHWKNKKSEED